ncbi:odorant receptor 2a-like [Aphis craccivora]|uniref:Odorant receptor 2a-like n=1 Tax=Aphis craccivora TaxID=307492 RepID=A0A6G0XUB4_APHCR|nr:odorant receptor 2a-like [Aphis craccivora]
MNHRASFIVGEFTESMGVTSMQTGFVILFCVIQMFMSCYIFDILHNKKDSMTFALYSCNWSEFFDMK